MPKEDSYIGMVLFSSKYQFLIFLKCHSLLISLYSLWFSIFIYVIELSFV